MSDPVTVRPADDNSAGSPTASQPSPMRRAFYGPDGLRAGWRAALFVLITVALLASLSTAAQFVLRQPRADSTHPLSPWVGLIFEVVSVLSVAGATLAMARFEKRRIASYGYKGPADVSRFVWGAVWGFAALSALVAALSRAHWLSLGNVLLHGPAAWGYGAVWLVMFGMVALFEESLLRGYLQATLTEGMGFWPAALTLSLLFGAMHGSNKGESPVGLFSAGAVGLVFCLSLWYTRSLWWAIGFHATWDWAQTFFYGTPDSGMVAQHHLLASQSTGPLLWSGGPTGPEGSLFIVPLLVLLAVGMWLWWGRRGLAPARTPYQL